MSGNWIEVVDNERVGVPNGLASLDALGKIAQNIPNAKVDGLGSLALKSSLVATDIPALATSKITGLDTALSGKVETSVLGAASGVATLDSSGKIAQNVPNAKVDGLGSLALKSSLVAADIPSLATSKITGLDTALSSKVNSSSLGVASGVATLDANSKIAQNIPNAKVDGLGSLALKSSLVAADIPSLDATKIASGTIADARIPALATSKITGLDTALTGKVNTSTTVNGTSLTSNITLKTSDLITKPTALPATGSDGEIVKVGGKLYVWKETA